MSKNKYQAELNKQAKLQFKTYAHIVNSKHFKPVPKNIKFKDKLSQNLYDITKKYTLLVLQQYVTVEKYVQNAKKHKGIQFNDKSIKQTLAEWKFIKTKILPKFNGSRESFASYVAFEKVGLASLTKKGLSQTYEVMLKQYHNLAKQVEELKKTVKEQVPKLKESLNESTYPLTEADIKSIILKPFSLIKKAFFKVIKVLIEGWAFILKHLGKLANEILSMINKLLNKFDNQLGRVIKYLLKAINPSFLETLKMFGATEDDIAEILGAQLRKGISLTIAFITGAGFVQSAIITFYATTAVLNKMATVGEYAEMTETVIDLLNEMNSEYFDELMQDL